VKIPAQRAGYFKAKPTIKVPNRSPSLLEIPVTINPLSLDGAGLMFQEKIRRHRII